MKIVLTTMMYRRYDVFEWWAKNFTHLKEKLIDDVDLIAVCVGSDGKKGRDICAKYGIEYMDHRNYPLGLKANYRLEFTRQFDADYIIFLGSDDLISESDIRHKLSLIEQGYDWISPMDIYYLDFNSMLERYSNGYTGTRRQGEPMAVGRCLSREVLDKLNWNLFNKNKNRGLDGSAHVKLSRIETNKAFYSHLDHGTCIMDVKSNFNINNFSKIIRLSNPSKGMFHKHFSHLERVD